MVVSVLKCTFQSSAPKELVHRDYNNFDRVIFKRELGDKLNQQINEYKYLIFRNTEYPCTTKKETTQS